ncbi:MAG: coproporphyrinogen dehydrogenase HemZ [Ruminococcaceae bacterium]|nr:coproporphyrinogen dehydrogenase HemZ [Oscillospiraceae bacterium]
MSEIMPWGILNGIRPVKIAMKLLNGGMSDEEVVAHFKNEYNATEEKAKLALEIAKVEKPIIDNMSENGISLYVGIPFCPTRCLYCSFVTNSIFRSKSLIPDYLDCLMREIEVSAEIVRENGQKIETVYIGGGTPTTLEARELEMLIGELFREFDLSDIKEFTVEAGRPDTINEDKLRVIKSFDIGRISINPQTMNEETLKIIGRNHTPSQIVEAYKLARKCGIDVINMDVIAGLPGESLEMFEKTIREVEELNPENTTVHTMSIKRSSRLREMIDEYDLTKGDEVSRMVDYAREYLADKGKYPYYLYRQKNMLGNLENIGYCKSETESLYNIFIMEEVQTILALGCGGVTKTVDRKTDRIERIFNVKEPKDYIERIDEMLKRKDCLRVKM